METCSVYAAELIDVTNQAKLNCFFYDMYNTLFHFITSYSAAFYLLFHILR